MDPRTLYAFDTAAVPWEERSSERIRRALLRKALYTDPDNGAEARGEPGRRCRRPVHHQQGFPHRLCEPIVTFLCLALLALPPLPPVPAGEVLAGLRSFYAGTARPDGSFQPGLDPAYGGMSDSAYSDLAPVTYAVVVHRTFGWTLPHAEKTAAFLGSRQQASGEFFNLAGTVDPSSPEGRTYNTTQGLVALRALGLKPRFDPLPIFEEILRADYKTLPPFSTSFFPLAYLCAGQPIPEKADRGIRELMLQDETGYLNDHIAATFHASHYYRLIGEETPKAEEMVERILRDQKPDGSWLLNMPSRDRHATFDAVFTLVQEGRGRDDCRQAVERAARWALSCRNPDGGFGHFPGSTSDADAVYFHVGTLVLAGVLKPADPLPADPHLLSWGHLMPLPQMASSPERWSARLPGWVAAVAFSPDGRRLAAAGADKAAHILETATGRELAALAAHGDTVAAAGFSPDGNWLATGSYDHTARIWNAGTAEVRHRLAGHRGVVLSLAFSPDSAKLATGSIDGSIKLWDVATGDLLESLEGHKSWVSSLAFGDNPAGTVLVSGSSDGTVKVWSVEGKTVLKSLPATTAEVRSIAISADGRHIAAGIRYGTIKVWETSAWKELHSFQGHPAEAWSVAFAPDGKRLATGGGDWNRGGLVKLWELGSGRQLGRWQHTGEVLTVAFSRDGLWIAAGAADRTVKAWKLSDRP